SEPGNKQGSCFKRTVGFSGSSYLGSSSVLDLFQEQSLLEGHHTENPKDNEERISGLRFFNEIDAYYNLTNEIKFCGRRCTAEDEIATAKMSMWVFFSKFSFLRVCPQNFKWHRVGIWSTVLHRTDSA